MAGYRSANIDLDALFDPDIKGDGPAANGYNVNGVPLKYAALKYGTKRADVGIRINNVDVSNLWAAKGTAVYIGPKDPGFAAEYINSRGSIHDIAAECMITIRADGTWAVTNGGTGGAITPSPTSGTWHNAPAAGVGAGCQMRWTDAGPWISLGVDRSQSVSAFATTGEGGPSSDVETMALQISIRNNDGTMEVRDLTAITAEASV